MSHVRIDPALRRNPGRCSQVFHPNVDTTPGITTFAIAGTLSEARLSSADLLIWKTIFHHTFGRSIDEEFAEAGRTVWHVDAGWTRSKVYKAGYQFVDGF